ncbi:MAG: class I SAM-dependent methyltransferase [Caulobacteraceae bacterium]
MTIEVGSDVYTNAFYDEQSSGSLRSARAILRGVFDLAPVATVLDVGCGVGAWPRAALDLGAATVVGVDGDYVDRQRLMIDRGSFRPRDLGETLALDAGDPTRFDLVMSLEVAEHLPADRARTFVSNLVAHGDLVLFSAAIPLQGGANHVNEQWPDYWVGIFDEAGYDCFDIIRAAVWDEDAIDWWYAQNTFVYARRESPSHASAASRGPATPSPMALVHPKKLEEAYGYLTDAYARQQSLLESKSWRVTEPLRAFGRFVSRGAEPSA